MILYAQLSLGEPQRRLCVQNHLLCECSFHKQTALQKFFNFWGAVYFYVASFLFLQFRVLDLFQDDDAIPFVRNDWHVDGFRLIDALSVYAVP